LDHKKR